MQVVFSVIVTKVGIEYSHILFSGKKGNAKYGGYAGGSTLKLHVIIVLHGGKTVDYRLYSHY